MEYGGYFLGVNLHLEVGYLNPNPSTNLGGKIGGKFMLKKNMLKSIFVTAAMSLISVTSVHAASYTVTPGDSLYNISKLFNTSITSISTSNNLSSTSLYPGQVLNVSCKTYAVQSGDSLYLIAQKYGVSLGALRQANDKWDNSIYPGEILNIPGSSSGTVSTSTVQASTQTQGAISTGGVSYTASDLDLLARLITAEADSEPHEAKVAVGAVVVNRLKDPRFPKTISSVIYQKDGGYYQFSPVVNGWINNPASQDSITAAKEALSGVDPTNGALYYFDDTTTNAWLWSKTIALRVDKMVFSYYN
jgi:spore germination cell wall hydrolase CwlJ-like protein